MNVSNFIKMAYENKYNWTLGENKPNQTQFKPNLSQLKPISMPIKPNSNPIQTQSNPILSAVEWANLETTPGGPHARNRLRLTGVLQNTSLVNTNLETVSLTVSSLKDRMPCSYIFWSVVND